MRSHNTFVAIGLAIVAASLVRQAHADAIVVTQAMKASTIAEIYVEDGRIRLELEIGSGDLEAFRNLLPDPIYEKLGHSPEPLVERFERFFLEDLVLRLDGGTPLPGLLREMEGRERIRRDLVTGEPLPVAEEEGETVLFAALEYPFRGQPDTLTIRAPTTRAGAAAAGVGFVVYHQGVPAMDFRYLTLEQTLDLDWDDPWYSRFRSRNLRRQYDAPLNVFLYVEPHEVRTEIIARPKDLQHWVDLGLAGADTIPAQAHEEVRRRAAEFLAGYSKVTIEGRPVEPTLDRIHFLRRTLRTSTVIDPPVDLDIGAATLGAIFTYPTDGLPEAAELTWDLFGPKIQLVPGAATDEAGPLRFFLQPDDNVLWWKNTLKNPSLPTVVEIATPPRRLPGAGALPWVFGLLVVVALARLLQQRRQGGELRRPAVASTTLALAFAVSLGHDRLTSMSDQRASGILDGLLHNVYLAFDFRGESEVYDVLARSVTGDLLQQTYLETKRGLTLANQGGAQVKVKEIEVVSVAATTLSGGVGFTARCVWNVSGSVGHWGHIHQRQNQYEADLRVEPVDGIWKITALDLLQEERL